VGTSGNWHVLLLRAMWTERRNSSSRDSVAIGFSELPGDLSALCQEIQSLCPDGSDDALALQDELNEKKKLLLWWD
jgi:hypothetical protein